jgi:hypothetical protein
MLSRAICHDCGVKEGQLHLPGCDMERCPFCGNQLISCRCVYDKLKVVRGSPLTDEQEQAWSEYVDEKGRIPWIQYPNLCARCGALWPEFFSVPTEEWERYVEPRMRREILCEACFKQIKFWIDAAAEE